ncbi:MAG: nucleoid-associated protein [Bacteroidales bacterium]|jgi:hypothetical protein|nr:nucleoid-associated protein [Bacteroidales bacterium]
MINHSQSHIERIAIHKVGSKHEGQGFELSESEFEVQDEATHDVLYTFFLNPFKTLDMYQFNLDTPSSDNSALHCITRIFETPVRFFEESKKLAELLYDTSCYEETKPGELYIVLFRNCEFNEELCNAIGIFKSERKDTFIRVYQNGGNFDIDHYNDGINVKKMDKGCLIFNTNQETGYAIKLIDNTKATERPYWTDYFLNIKPVADNYFTTNNFLQICKEFSENVLTDKNNIERNEQIGFMNNSYNYFKNNEFYDEIDFKKTVLQNPEIIESFDEFKHDFEQAYEIPARTEFEISPDAVKKSKKYVRSIIKLDKNFHIYVHSKPDYIEKGFDDNRKMKYYRVFFEEES